MMGWGWFFWAVFGRRFSSGEMYVCHSRDHGGGDDTDGENMLFSLA